MPHVIAASFASHAMEAIALLGTLRRVGDAEKMEDHDGSLGGGSEGLLTTGKRATQGESLPLESGALTYAKRDRLLRLNWMGFLLEHSPDIRSHVEEFKQILLLPPAEPVYASMKRRAKRVRRFLPLRPVY